jgi:hypothetical protein
MTLLVEKKKTRKMVHNIKTLLWDFFYQLSINLIASNKMVAGRQFFFFINSNLYIFRLNFQDLKINN